MEKRKNLIQLRKNIKKNINDIFVKRFSLIKLVYFIIKKSNEINKWRIEAKNNDIKTNRILTSSVKKRIKLIQNINDRIYKEILKDDTDVNTQLKIEITMKLLDFLNKNKECWEDFEGGIKLSLIHI